MAGSIRRLFRIGKLPADLRAAAEAESLIHLSEFISVVARFTGQIPGRRSVGLVRGYGGALVLTNQRVLGTLSEAGLLLEIADLSLVDPEFSGTLSLNFKSELSPEILSRVPTRSIAFDVPPKFVYSVLGVPRG